MTEGAEHRQPGLAHLVQGAAHLAQEAVYLTVGLGLLGVNRVQARRRELQGKLGGLPIDDGVQAARAEVGRQVQNLDHLVEEAVALIGSSLEPLGGHLPPAARDLAQRAYSGVVEISTQLRDLLGPAA